MKIFHLILIAIIVVPSAMSDSWSFNLNKLVNHVQNMTRIRITGFPKDQNRLHFNETSEDIEDRNGQVTKSIAHDFEGDDDDIINVTPDLIVVEEAVSMFSDFNHRREEISAKEKYRNEEPVSTTIGFKNQSDEVSTDAYGRDVGEGMVPSERVFGNESGNGSSFENYMSGNEGTTPAEEDRGNQLEAGATPGIELKNLNKRKVAKVQEIIAFAIFFGYLSVMFLVIIFLAKIDDDRDAVKCWKRRQQGDQSMEMQ